MTLHASKGLEFPAVAIIGLEEGTLPHARAQTSDAELEEERRLAFVGVTRAMKHLHLTSADRRTVRGVTERTIRSRFLEEIGREHVIVSDMSDASLGAYDDAFDDDRRDERIARADRAPKHDLDRIDRAREKRLARVAPRSPGGAPDGATASEYPKGAIVAHPQFGQGVVLSCTGGANARVTVEFKGLGKKTLVLEYARLKRLG